MSLLAKNQLVNALIKGYTAEGAGVARIDGFVVFVPGTVRGDVVRIRLVKVLSTHGFGRVEEIITPSPQRVVSQCAVFPKCGGCDFWCMDYEEELAQKAERVHQAITRIGGFDCRLPHVVPSPRVAGYRNKAQFPLCLDGGKMAFGFYRKRSHDIVPFTRCLIQDEHTCLVAEAICRWADASGVLPAANGGILRHIYIRREGDKSLVCLVAEKKALPNVPGLIDAIRTADPGVAGIVLNINRRPDNVILGEKTLPLWGDSRLAVTVLGKVFALSPHSFYQVNKPQAEDLYRQALAWAGEADTILDLYCGVGTMTLALADQCKEVIGVEIVPQAIEDAQENARRNKVENIRFLLGDAGQAAAKLAGEGLCPEVILCDPPRKGMDAAALEAVVRMNPRRIIYVACDPAALARDSKALAAYGWRLEELKAWDMFPRTANVETAALLVRE